MTTQDVDLNEIKTPKCTIWGTDEVLEDAEKIAEYKQVVKKAVIDNLLVGVVGDDGTYKLKNEIKRDLLRMQKGVADTSDRYYIAYATLLDKTFHFAIAIDDLSESEVLATLYLTESVENYPHLESVRSFVASIKLPTENLKASVYKAFNLVNTIPDNNDGRLIQNLLLRMLEIVNQASPKSESEPPHADPKAQPKEKGDEKKPAAKSKGKPAEKPAKKPAKKKKVEKKKAAKKDDKKKEKKLEDLLGKKYDVYKPVVTNKIDTIETIQIPTESKNATGDKNVVKDDASQQEAPGNGDFSDLLMQGLGDQNNESQDDKGLTEGLGDQNKDLGENLTSNLTVGDSENSNGNYGDSENLTEELLNLLPENIMDQGF